MSTNIEEWTLTNMLYDQLPILQSRKSCVKIRTLQLRLLGIHAAEQFLSILSLPSRFLEEKHSHQNTYSIRSQLTSDPHPVEATKRISNSGVSEKTYMFTRRFVPSERWEQDKNELIIIMYIVSRIARRLCSFSIRSSFEYFSFWSVGDRRSHWMYCMCWGVDMKFACVVYGCCSLCICIYL